MSELEDDAPPEKKRSTLKILGLIGCGCLVLMGGCFALVGGAAWWASGKFEGMVMEVLQEEPAVLEHLGELESCTMEIMQMAEGGSDAMIFTVEGSKGTGTVRIKQHEFADDAVDINGGVLILPNGDEYPLGE